MFVGHLAVALVAKRGAPAVNLGWLMAGVTALDLIWPVFVLAGVEHVRIEPGATAFTPLVFDSYPWSHSLVMAPIWGLALVAAARWRHVTAPAWLLVALVVSHWFLDFASHAPDLPLWPGPSPRLGLGLMRREPIASGDVHGFGAETAELARAGRGPVGTDDDGVHDAADRLRERAGGTDDLVRNVADRTVLQLRDGDDLRHSCSPVRGPGAANVRGRPPPGAAAVRARARHPHPGR